MITSKYECESMDVCLHLCQVLQDMVPPKKHLLRHQPANAQIGLMEGNTFCTTLQPRLFTMDLNVMEHKVFYTEVYEIPNLLTLITSIFNYGNFIFALPYICLFFFSVQLLNLCEAEDAALMKLPCYKSLPSLVPLRIAALSEWTLLKSVCYICKCSFIVLCELHIVLEKAKHTKFARQHTHF